MSQVLEFVALASQLDSYCIHCNNTKSRYWNAKLQVIFNMQVKARKAHTLMHAEWMSSCVLHVPEIDNLVQYYNKLIAIDTYVAKNVAYSRRFYY